MDTTRLHTSRNVAQPFSPVQYIQATAGNRTRAGPSWAMHNISITADSREAKGTPATARPIAPSTVWTTAVTPTPSATLRMAFPARMTDSSPRSPARRRPKRRTPLAADSPLEYMTAERITTSRNWTRVPPRLPAWSNTHLAASEAYGPSLASSPAGPASAQPARVAESLLPTKGTLATHSGGCGRPDSATFFARPRTSLGMLGDGVDRRPQGNHQQEQHAQRHHGHRGCRAGCRVGPPRTSGSARSRRPASSPRPSPRGRDAGPTATRRSAAGCR